MKIHRILIGAVLVIANSSPATDLYWSGDGSNEGGPGTWDATNPHFGTAPSGPFTTAWNNTGSDNVTFEATPGTVTVSSITNNGTVTDNAGYTFSGTALTIGPNTVFNVASGKTLTMSSVVAGLGGTLTKNGLGSFVQNAANTYSNGTVINDGTWVLANASGGFGSAGAGNILTINNVSGPVTFVRGSQTGATSPGCPIVQNGDIILGDGSAMSLNVAFPIPVANSAYWQIKGANRKITTGANSAAGVWVIGNNSTTAGHITEDGLPRTLTFDGAGTVTINAENDITGGVILRGGTLRIGGTIVNPFGPSPLTLAGGRLSQAANHTGGPIANAVNVTGDSGITTTATTAGQVLEFSGSITSSAGTTLTLVDSANSGSFLPRISGPATFSGMIAINNNTGGVSTATTTLNLFNITGNDQTFNDVISGNGSLTRSSSSAGTGGTTYLNAANTYSGGTTLVDGAIGFGISSTPGPNSGGPPLNNGPIGTGTLTVSPVSGAMPMVFSSGGDRDVGNAFNLATTAAPLIVSNADTLTLYAPITGPGSVTKVGAGQLRVSPHGASSDYTGGTTLSEGEIAFDSSSSEGTRWGPIGQGTLNIGEGTALSALSNPRTLNNPLVFSGTSATLTGSRDLTFGGNADLSGNAVRLTVNNSAQTTLSGQISNGGLTKDGPSPLTLTGANTYTGPTTVSTGTLLVNSPGSLDPASAVTVNSGATLGGTGTVNGSVTVNAGGSISAGASPGLLTVGGGLNLSAGGTNVWELAALKDNADGTAGTDFDQIVLTGGSLTLGGSSKLKIVFTSAATAPDSSNPFWQSPRSWTIISATGAASNFAAIENGNYAAGTFATSVQAGGIVLTFAPGAGPTPVTSFGITNGPGSNMTLGYSGGSGSQFVLLQTNNVAAPLTLWTRLQTNTVSPGNFTITPGSDPQEFYRVKSE